MKKSKEIECLEKDERTLEKRRVVKEKLKSLGETEENTELIIASIESYCQLILESINKNDYG